LSNVNNLTIEVGVTGEEADNIQGACPAKEQVVHLIEGKYLHSACLWQKGQAGEGCSLTSIQCQLLSYFQALNLHFSLTGEDNSIVK